MRRRAAAPGRKAAVQFFCVQRVMCNMFPIFQVELERHVVRQHEHLLHEADLLASESSTLPKRALGPLGTLPFELKAADVDAGAASEDDVHRSIMRSQDG
jgi:hypothetical protein